MKKPSFEVVVLDLAEACEFLRSFTLAQRGFTPKHGALGIQRVMERCDHLEKLFAKGPRATKSKLIVASARTKVLAAKARLAVLGILI